MHIVIIGASGNVGTALLRAIRERCADWKVIGVSRRLPPADPPYDVADWRSIDVAGPVAVDELTEVFTGADVVVNLAWGFQPTRDAAWLERVGVGGLTSVLEAADAAGVGQLIHMSSVGTYRQAEPGQRVDEGWSTVGMSTSVYSRHKAAAERVLDRYLAAHPDGPMVITRFRPGLVLQSAAGSALLRYGLPGYLPAGLLRFLPVLPLDRRLLVPVVHADDLAAAVLLAVDQRAGGAFNVAAEPPIGRDDIAAALGARPLQVPARLIHAVVALTWAARLQRLDAGWIDLAFGVPLLETTKVRAELGWEPRTDAKAALRHAVSGMTAARSTCSPVLRKRTVRAQLAELMHSGPITRRHFS